jgi:hypothetical protein
MWAAFPADATSGLVLLPEPRRPIWNPAPAREVFGIVTLTDSNARVRNPGSDRHMRFRCLTGAGGAAPKAEIGENCPNVTIPSQASSPCISASPSSLPGAGALRRWCGGLRAGLGPPVAAGAASPGGSLRRCEGAVTYPPGSGPLILIDA